MCENNIESVPEWLNEHFIQSNLRNHYKNDEMTVFRYDIKTVTEKRQSSIYRIAVVFGVSLEGEEVSYCYRGSVEQQNHKKS